MTKLNKAIITTIFASFTITAAQAEIRRDSRVSVNKAKYSNNHYSSYKSPVKRILSSYDRAGRPIYRYVRTSNSRYGNSYSSCRRNGVSIRVRR